MATLLSAIGIDPAWLVKTTFEPNLLLLFVVCLIHSYRSHGWRRTLREFSAGLMLTALAESAGVLSGAYVYPGFYLYILATPFGNPASWVALVYILMKLTDRLVFGRAALDPDPDKPLRIGKSLVGTLVILALCDATLAVCIDLVLDPLATIFNWWIWVPHAAGVHDIASGVVDPYNFSREVWMTTPDNPIGAFFAGFFEGGWRYPTRVFGIPLINFIAWVVFVFTFTFEFRWVESRRHWSEGKKTLVLWGLVLADTPILAMLLIPPNL